MADSHLLLLVNFATFGWLELIKPTHYMPYCMGLVEHILTRCIFRTNVVNPIYNPHFSRCPPEKDGQQKKTIPSWGMLGLLEGCTGHMCPSLAVRKDPKKVHRDFRLWLTSYPSNKSHGWRELLRKSTMIGKSTMFCIILCGP